MIDQREKKTQHIDYTFRNMMKIEPKTKADFFIGCQWYVCVCVCAHTPLETMQKLIDAFCSLVEDRSKGHHSHGSLYGETCIWL